MATFDVWDRLEYLRQEHPNLMLYALLDGAQYLEHTGTRVAPRPEAIALFEGTADSALAFAGPWLFDAGAMESEQIAELVDFERTTYGVSWLIAYQDLQGLAQLLQLQMEAELPDGRKALLRFWDARVLAGLPKILNVDQRRAFFGHVCEWHLLLNRTTRVRVGRGDV